MTLDQSSRRFAPGDVVVRREVVFGEVWLAVPTICVEDSADLLALYVPTDAEFAFPPATKAGPHPWQGRFDRWQGHGKLSLQRPGEAHSVDLFWTGPDRAFAGWYFNLQDPYRRTAIGVDTLDHELDLWWPVDEPHYRWKDVEKFEQRLADGWFPGLGAAIRAEGDRIAARLDAGERWWDGAWAAWRPDPSWPRPKLPAGWDAVPATTAPVAQTTGQDVVATR
jgi:hypothetical protein